MRVLVVGSGASGVHFALTALRKGHEVAMLDVGNERPPAVHPEATFDGLKTALSDPVAYFLGEECEGVVYPATKASYYGHPPSKGYVFATPERFAARAKDMEPVFSFARGGFAEAWTAGVYPFNDADLADFPIGYADLRPHYQEVARRIGISAQRDDLERFMPFDAAYQEPLRLDAHSERLLARYAEAKGWLNQKLGFYLGRSRVATLTRDLDDRRACDHLGRCLWGCPTDAIYRPSVTLRQCLAHGRFSYHRGVFVRHFDYDGRGRVIRMNAEVSGASGSHPFEADLFVLAAGALCSSKIFLDSVYRKTGRIIALTGLMDNRQVHVPFLNLSMIGRAAGTANYQFHHLAFGLRQQDPQAYVHGQITTLKAASVHPIAASMPADLRTALRVFRGIRSGLGIANVNFHDRRRAESQLTLHPMADSDQTQLVIAYANDPAEPGHAVQAVKLVKQALGRLGCLVPPGMTRVLPKGASVHYSGTIPMSRTESEYTCSPACQSHDFSNLYLVDGATFPFLPAKNLTFTLMANAVRVAELVL